MEAVANIGGHLMPPVMGASVFLMAAISHSGLGIKFPQVVMDYSFGILPIALNG